VCVGAGAEVVTVRRLFRKAARGAGGGMGCGGVEGWRARSVGCGGLGRGAGAEGGSASFVI
jgi:hypothetical protein